MRNIDLQRAAPAKPRTVIHIDMNSYFATIEQQANPRLRGKPIGVTGGDRMTRTVLGTASVEAKKLGIKTGMSIQQALRIYPKLILVKGDSDKYLSCTEKFINILKKYSPYLEVFSIDESFMELTEGNQQDDPMAVAMEIKERIHARLGEWVTCSIGVSYNKTISKLAGSLNKPNGLVGIMDPDSAMMILDQVPIDEICGIGSRIKNRLLNMGVYDFKTLRNVPLNNLLLEFKSYGLFLYNISRGIDNTPVLPFYEKEEVKSVGHRHTIFHDTNNPTEIKQILLKLTELIARKLRSKKLVGRTVSCWFRYALNFEYVHLYSGRIQFEGDGKQVTIPLTQDGLEIFNGAWTSFLQLWDGQTHIRMIGASISNLQTELPQNLTFLEDTLKRNKITKALDNINDRFGEFTLQRGILLKSAKVTRKPNPFLADYRFKFK